AKPLIHAKVILADESRALVGSINLSYASLELNRELGVLTAEPQVLARLQQVLADDWALATGAANTNVVDWRRAEEYVGKQITVEGQIVRTHDTGKVTFLNFSEDYRSTLSIVIFASAYDLFPEPPVDYFRDARVRVTGRVQMYQGAPEIVVESPDQIQIIDSPPRSRAPTSGTAAEPVGAGPATVISWQQAGDYVGRRVTVEGEVVRTHDTGKVTFLNFTHDWPGTLSIVIFASDYARFPQKPAELYLHRHIRVTGQVREYRGAPEIVVESPGQIQITAGSEATPTPAAPAGVVPWSQAGQYVGRRITVEGRVVDTHDTGHITFLNFSSRHDAFVVVIFAEDYALFPDLPASLYNGKKVWVTGEITTYKGVPQIVVHSPDQIEVFP
ncbi:MAG: hypothetical protein D6775_01455, partial [Caldilineae bacterium]